MEPNILTEGQPDPVNEEIRSGVEQALTADAAKASAPPASPVEEGAPRPSIGQALIDATNTALQYLGKSNSELVDLYNSRRQMAEIDQEMRKRSFAGLGQMNALPKDEHVSILRQNQNNPEAIAGFEWKYGQGSAQRYLRAPSSELITKLMANKDNPEAVDAFNGAFGGVASLYIVLNDPKSSQVDKEIAAYQLMQAYKTGRVEENAGVVDAIRSGYRRAVGETIRSVASGVDLATGGDAAQQIQVPDNTAVKDSPMLYSVVEAVSQFATGRVALGALTGGAGNLGTAARFLREIALSGTVDAFAFNPNDPRLADLAKQFGLDNNWTTDKLDADWKNRLARAGEGAIIGSLIEGIAFGVRAYRARGAGNADEAAKLQEQSKTKFEEAATKAETYKEPTQLDLGLGDMNNPLEAAQLRMQRMQEAGRAGVPNTPADDLFGITSARQGVIETREPMLPMDLPVDPNRTRNTSTAVDLSTVDPSIRTRPVDPNVPAQSGFDLPQPPPGPRTYDGQGNLFDLPPTSPTRQADTPVSDAPRAPVAHSEAELSVRTGDQVVSDVLNNKGPAQRALDEAVGNVSSTLPPSVRELLDRVPNFENYSAVALREYTAPVLDDFLDVARNSMETMDRIISKNLPLADAEKLQALLTQASKRANVLADSLKSDLDVALTRQITDSAEIDSIKAQMTEVNSYIANIQKAYEPLGTISGRLLQMRQMEGPIATAFKGDIEQLRASGVPETEINRMIADSVQNADKTRLDRLNAQRRVAIAQNDFEKAQKLDADIAKELESVQKEATQKLSTQLGKANGIVVQIGKDLQTITMKNLLSSLATPIRGTLGAAGVRLWDNAALAAGAIRTQGLAQGLSTYKYLSQSRALGIRSGYETASQAYLQMFKDALSDAWKNEGKASALGYDGSSKTRNMQASNYGLDGVKGKVVDTGFSVIDKLDLPLRFTDELISNIFNRSGVGEAAGYRFLINKQDQVTESLARLRDPKLTDVQKEALKADLKRMRSKNPEIKLEDGSWVSLKDFVKREMDSSFDETGRFINEAVTDRTDYLLLKNEFSSKLARSAEAVLNQPAAIPVRILFLPFIRNPVNGFKVYMESVPGLRKVFSDIDSQLSHPDPLVRMRAEGKIMLGWVVQGAAFFSAYQGYSTYVNTRDRRIRELDAASSSVGNASIQIGNYGIPMTGMDPLSGHFIMPTTIVNSILTQFHRIDQSDKNIQAAIARGERVEALSSVERAMMYGNAILQGSLLGVGSLLLEQPTITSMKDVVDLIPGSSKAPQDAEADFDRQLGKLLKNQLGKFNPALNRAVNNANDPLTYDIKTLSDAFTVEFMNRDALPLRYDALGRPIESKNPYRGLTGPLFPVYNREIGTKEQYVIDSLQRMGDITGTYIIFNGTPPDELLRKYKVDLTQINSAVGERRVSDEFAKELLRVKPGGLPTLTDRLFTIFSKEAELAKAGVGYGNYKFDGTLVDNITKIISQHREAAWKTVLAREEAAHNAELIKYIQRARAESQGAKSPLLDLPYDRSIQPVFPNR